MNEHNITVEGGTSVRLPTGGKYCDRDVVVHATKVGTELPALTNPAGEGDVLMGKQFIDQDGYKGWGALQQIAYTPNWETSLPLAVTQDSSDYFFRITDGTNFGDATPDDVAAGKTFTSAGGARQTGAASGGGAELVTVTLSLYGGTNTVAYMGANGPVVVENAPYSLSIDVVKDSIITIEYSGGTYLVLRDFWGGEPIYDGNPWIPGSKYATLLRFWESGYVVYEEV